MAQKGQLKPNSLIEQVQTILADGGIYTTRELADKVHCPEPTVRHCIRTLQMRMVNIQNINRTSGGARIARYQNVDAAKAAQPASEEALL